MNFRDIRYDWPLASYLLLLTLFFAFLFWMLYEYRRRTLQGFAVEPTLAKLIVPRSRLYYLVNTIAILAAYSAATLALMGPKGSGSYLAKEGEDGRKTLEEKLLSSAEKEGEKVQLRRKAHDLIFLLDASASMALKDTRPGKSRLEYAKEIVDEIVGALDGQAAALYAFTAEATPIVPPTNDYLFFRLMLRSVQINEGASAGTDFVEALDAVKRRHFGALGKLKTLVLLSDGGDTRLEALQGKDREEQLEAIVSRLGDTEKENVRVFGVGMGSAEGQIIPNITFEGKPVSSSLDEELLKKLSDKGRGKYYFANAISAFAIAQDIVKEMGRDDPFVEATEVPKVVGKVERSVLESGAPDMVYKLYYQVPLGVAILLLTLPLIFPEVRKRGFKRV